MKKRMTTCGSSFAISDSCTCVVAEGCWYLGVFWTYFWTLGDQGNQTNHGRALEYKSASATELSLLLITK